MSYLADLLSVIFERRAQMPGRAGGNVDSRDLAELVQALAQATDETSARDLAEVVLARYADLEDSGKLSFFSMLATTLTIDPGAVRAALDAYEAEPGRETYRAFAAAAEPPRQELIRRLNQVPGATAALVRMRADLLRLGRNDPRVMAFDLDFRHLFASWFNRGFLVLRPISWESPAHILEKIIAYEAVHAIENWDDLRRRLAPEDRRCFAFFHPAMPDEPLIFVEVALTKGVPTSVQGLLEEDRPPMRAADANTAVFYSISNTQDGLAGVSFGNALIKTVAADLSLGLPGLKTFVTLSPIPGLMRWLEGRSWDEVDLPALAAQYLLNAKRADGRPLDPVARFHLGNGARVERVHEKADISDKGRAQSGGMMVSYLYDLPKLAENHETYITTGTVPAAPKLRALAESAPASEEV